MKRIHVFIPRLLNSLVIVGWNSRYIVSSFQLRQPLHFHATILRFSNPVCCRATRSLGSVARSRKQQNTLSSFPSRAEDYIDPDRLQPGSKVLVEVMSFGPLGASVQVVAASHDTQDVIPEEASPLAIGLISQQEIQYFRRNRENLDVVRGEVLPAVVEQIRDDGKLRIGLRPYGGRGKAEGISELIMKRLQESGELNLGDKSPPSDIEAEFPGTSKAAFKKAVSALYKQQKVVPGPLSIRLYGSG